MKKIYTIVLVVLCMMTVSLFIISRSSDMAAAQSSGGGGSAGGDSAGTGQGGRGSQADGGSTFGPSVGASGDAFGPGTGPGRGMAGGYQSFGPPQTDNFQFSHYGYPGSETGNSYLPHGPEVAAAFHQSQYHGSIPGPAPASAVPAEGGMASLQARGVTQGTCMWECTADLTPIECEQLCNRK